MGKRSKKLPVRYEKDQLGCMSGLINMFDFRQGRTTQRLLSDRKRGTRSEEGARIPRNNLDMLTNPNENCAETDGEVKTTAVADFCKPSVKKLIEEEMFGDQEMKEQNDGELQSNSENKKKNRKRIKKIRWRSCDGIRDIGLAEKSESECLCHQNSLQRSGNSLDLEKIMEHTKFSSDIAEKLSEAINLLISQKLLDRKDLTEEDGDIHTSKKLIDALQELSTDEELCPKFSQDPNSLLAKYMQLESDDHVVDDDEEAKSLAGFSDEEISNVGRSDKLVDHKRPNFFRRKVKSQENNEISQPSNKIVILKQGQQLLFATILREKAVIIMLYRKKCHGKEYPGDIIPTRSPSEWKNLSDHNGISFKENSGRAKDHFFVERIARPSPDKLKGHEIDRVYDSMPHPIPAQRASNIYVEAKKHLSEMLSIGDEHRVISSKQLPRTLGRILSLPEYNSSPLQSPRKMSFSDSDKTKKVNENTGPSGKEDSVNLTSQTIENLDLQPCVNDETSEIDIQVVDSSTNITDEITHIDEASDSCCSTTDKMSSGGDVQIVEVTEIDVREDNNAVHASSIVEHGSTTGGEDQTGDSSEVVDEQRDSMCMNVDSCKEDKMPKSPPNSSASKKAEDYENASDNILERPSPVSVLDPLFMEEDISPASIRSQSADTPIQSLQIQFEEIDSSSVAKQALESDTEGNELVFEYVNEVLQASGLNWEELYLKSISSEKFLEKSLIDSVEFIPNLLCCDEKQLLFDCINEVFTEIYEPDIRPLPSMKHAVHEVWKGVNWHFVPLPLPRILDQIVRKDMSKSGSWMDLQFDLDIIGCEMCEAILEDLMEDVVLSCVNHFHLENGGIITIRCFSSSSWDDEVKCARQDLKSLACRLLVAELVWRDFLMTSKYSQIDDVCPGRIDWKIKARVLNLWTIPNFHNHIADERKEMIFMVVFKQVKEKFYWVCRGEWNNKGNSQVKQDNGTRLMVMRLGDHVIEGQIMNGSHAEEKVFIPRMMLQPSEYNICICRVRCSPIDSSMLRSRGSRAAVSLRC
ncbi:uncharacterized protein [Rutidosis leptorrhynchoides]|uniref:uncharacterized protein n=1 Tax=Rutidosis leptorrhynchoides TaxID=125765 RepID=UPI003A9A0105